MKNAMQNGRRRNLRDVCGSKWVKWSKNREKFTCIKSFFENFAKYFRNFLVAREMRCTLPTLDAKRTTQYAAPTNTCASTHVWRYSNCCDSNRETLTGVIRFEYFNFDCDSIVFTPEYYQPKLFIQFQKSQKLNTVI